MPHSTMPQTTQRPCTCTAREHKLIYIGAVAYRPFAAAHCALTRDSSSSIAGLSSAGWSAEPLVLLVLLVLLAPLPLPPALLLPHKHMPPEQHPRKHRHRSTLAAPEAFGSVKKRSSMRI